MFLASKEIIMNKNLSLGLIAAAFLSICSLSMAQNDNTADNNDVAVITVSQIGRAHV